MGCAPIHYLVPHRDWVGDVAGHCPGAGFCPAWRGNAAHGSGAKTNRPPTPNRGGCCGVLEVSKARYRRVVRR